MREVRVNNLTISVITTDAKFMAVIVQWKDPNFSQNAVVMLWEKKERGFLFNPGDSRKLEFKFLQLLIFLSAIWSSTWSQKIIREPKWASSSVFIDRYARTCFAPWNRRDSEAFDFLFLRSGNYSLEIQGILQAPLDPWSYSVREYTVGVFPFGDSIVKDTLDFILQSVIQIIKKFLKDFLIYISWNLNHFIASRKSTK